MSSVTILENTEFTGALFAQLAGAKKSVYVSAFSFNMAEAQDLALSVRNLVRLLGAKKRAGVDVRVLLGTGYKSAPTAAIQSLDISNEVTLTVLSAFGVPARFHAHAKLQSSHRKMIVIDKCIVFAGSHNLSSRALSVGNDDSVAVDDAVVGAELAREFRLMWTKGTRVAARDLVPINAAFFSTTVGKVAPPGKPETVKDAIITTLLDAHYFTALLDELATAKQSIDVAMFYFGGTKRPNAITSRIADALIAAHKRGVAVRVLLDRDRPEDIYGSERTNKLRFDQLKQAGITVAFDAPETANHSKLVVIDHERVMIGSHNWTEGSASRYQEMSFAIASKPLAVSYCARLDRRFKAAIKAVVVPVP